MDSVDPLRFVFAFLFVLGLIGLMAWGLRQYGNSKTGKALFGGMKGEGSRIQVMEVRYLDPKRKLVLIRRDQVEHLLLLSEGRDLVVESDIPASMIEASEPKGPHA